MNSKPVIEELKRLFSDDAFKRASAERLVRAKYVWKTKDCNPPGQSCAMLISTVFDVKPGVKHHWGISNTLPTIFGRVSDNFTRYNKPTFGYCQVARGRCGVEILGLKPLAKDHTYSSDCMMTIPELKEACKKNGIKVKSSWKKQDMLHALMKV